MDSVSFGGKTVLDAAEKFIDYLNNFHHPTYIENVHVNHSYENDDEGRITGEFWEIVMYCDYCKN
jgi:hypothetical protein